MDYSDFRFRAVVDWIEIEIYTATPTNFHTLKKVMGLPFVDPQNKGAGGAATIFRFKLHDPACWNDVTRVLLSLKTKHPFSQDPTITSVEVAFDAYSKGKASPNELAELAAYYYRGATQPVSGNRRLYWKCKGNGKAIPRQFPSLVRHISEGWQIGIGDKNADQYQHIYFKTVDHNKKLLPVVTHRARIEITLRGKRLACTMEEWESYDFTETSQFFKFRKPKNDLDPYMKMSLEATRQIGERRKRNRKEGGTRLYPKPTRADTVLNRKAYDTLRDLSRRWRTN